MSIPRPPLTTTTSLWPAASVVLLAVAMLAGFMIINLATSTPVATTTTLPLIVGGLPVQTGASSGAQLLGGCHQAGSPPQNIVGSFLLPVGSQARGAFTIVNQGAGEFDCHRSFVTKTSAAKLLGFYAGQLQARGWNNFSSGASDGQPQLLFQKAGTDTFYWVLGITVNHASAGAINWTFRIYQNSAAI